MQRYIRQVLKTDKCGNNVRQKKKLTQREFNEIKNIHIDERNNSIRNIINNEL